MYKSLDKPCFFITNISKKNVCLSDLAFTVPAGRCYDLLNDNFHYTIEQLKASLKDGSLYKKRKYIKISKGKPKFKRRKIDICEHPIITKSRSAVKVESPQFDELIFSDEMYANQMAELEED